MISPYQVHDAVTLLTRPADGSRANKQARERACATLRTASNMLASMAIDETSRSSCAGLYLRMESRRLAAIAASAFSPYIILDVS